MVRVAARGVAERDLALARSISGADAELDRLETEVDRAVVSSLARFPARGDDLRALVVALKMVTEVERIGDHAVNLADRAIDLGQGPGMEPGFEFPAMAEVALGMIRSATSAFALRDTAMARSVIERDDEVDELHRVGLQRLALAAASAPDQANRAFRLSNMLRQVERIADHAVRMAQLVIFLVDGADVRHGRLIA